jgi:hypothetical protein
VKGRSEHAGVLLSASASDPLTSHLYLYKTRSSVCLSRVIPSKSHEWINQSIRSIILPSWAKAGWESQSPPTLLLSRLLSYILYYHGCNRKQVDKRQFQCGVLYGYFPRWTCVYQTWTGERIYLVWRTAYGTKLPKLWTFSEKNGTNGLVNLWRAVAGEHFVYLNLLLNLSAAGTNCVFFLNDLHKWIGELGARHCGPME